MKRPLVWVALAYIATLGVVSCFWGEYPKIFFYILSFIAIVGAFYRRKPMIYMLAGAVLGMAVIIPHYSKFLEIRSKTDQIARLTLSVEETRFYGDRFGEYRGDGILRFSDGSSHRCALILAANQPYAADEGQTIVIDVKVTEVKAFWEGSGNEKLTVRQLGEISVSDTPLHPLKEYFIRLNRRLTAQSYRIMPAQQAAILNGIIFGDGRGIDSKVRDVLNTAALSHIVVVSGQHLMVAASIVTILLRDKRKPLTVWISLLCGWGFAALTGFSPSMLRGAVMFTVAQVGLLFDRRSDSVSALCLATILMTVYDPTILLNFSFILSAGAVLGIGLVGTRITKEGISAYEKLLGEISTKSAGRIGIVGTILGAQFGVLPGLVYLNGSIPTYGLITNLLVLPILLPLMLFGGACILLSFILPDLAAVLAILSGGLIQMIMRVGTLSAALPGALLPFGHHHQLLWLALAVLFACSGMFYDFDRLTRRIIALSLLLSLLVGSLVQHHYSGNTYDLYLFEGFNSVLYAKDKVGVLIGIPEKDDLYQLKMLLKRSDITELRYVVDTTDLSSDQPLVELADGFIITNLISSPNPLLQNTSDILQINLIDKSSVDQVILQGICIKIDYYTEDFSTPTAYIERDIIVEKDCKVIKLYMPLTGVNSYKIRVGDTHDLS